MGTAIQRSGIVGVGVAIVLLGSAAFAQDAATTQVPLKEVVLFNSGVGFFEHRGKVSGDAEVPLEFNVADINDLLKSMVVQDLGGGHVSTVAYGSKDPISKTLKSFAIDLTDEPTLGSLLKQVRGEKVKFATTEEITGTIVAVEKKQVPAGDDGGTVEVEMLLLLTEGGLRRVSLETFASLQFVNEDLNAEFQKALTLLAASHSTERKTVGIRFTGQGDREVRVGYIQEMPVWKTSYRLVLDEEKQPLLQGWAIVENPTERDWSGVKLTLVSGRPISFTMDLYQPLYAPRPAVQMDLYSSLRPRLYEQDLAAGEAEFRRKASEVRERQLSAGRPAAAAAMPGAPGTMLEGKSQAGQGQAGGMMGMGMMPGQAPARGEMAGRAAGAYGGYAGEARDEVFAFSSERWDVRQGVQSLAQAGEVGELFRYAIENPVDLERQQSAMLPIVNEEVEGEKVSIYNQNVHAKHPLNGLRLKNTTPLYLMQGPVTVFDGGTYAGDARIEDMPPASERLISYAMDLEVEVAPESKPSPDEILNVRLLKGTMFVERKYVRLLKYAVKNSGDESKKVLVEYPVEPEWKLVNPKEPAEKTRSEYRFTVEAKPGEPASLALEFQRTETQGIGLSDINDNTIRIYQSAKVVRDEVKQALAEIVRRKLELAGVAQERTEREQEIAQISEEQSRIRENMSRLDRTGELYSRYVKKFSQQEDRIEALRDEIAGFQKKENELKKALDDYLMGLNIQ